MPSLRSSIAAAFLTPAVALCAQAETAKDENQCLEDLGTQIQTLSGAYRTALESLWEQDIGFWNKLETQSTLADVFLDCYYAGEGRPARIRSCLTTMNRARELLDSHQGVQDTPDGRRLALYAERFEKNQESGQPACSLP